MKVWGTKPPPRLSSANRRGEAQDDPARAVERRPRLVLELVPELDRRMRGALSRAGRRRRRRG